MCCICAVVLLSCLALARFLCHYLHHPKSVPVLLPCISSRSFHHSFAALCGAHIPNGSKLWNTPQPLPAPHFSCTLFLVLYSFINDAFPAAVPCCWVILQALLIMHALVHFVSSVVGSSCVAHCVIIGSARGGGYPIL